MRSKDEILRVLAVKRDEDLRQLAAKRAKMILDSIDESDRFIDGKLSEGSAMVGLGDLFEHVEAHVVGAYTRTMGDREEILREVTKRLESKRWTVIREVRTLWIS